MTGMWSAPDPEQGAALDPAQIRTRPSTPGWTIAVSGEIDIATSALLRSQLDPLVDGGEPIVVDLTDMTFIDSSGLGVLVEMLNRRQGGTGRGITLRGMQEPVRRVFEITGLTDLFEHG